jgi:hypothetical protein
MTAVEWFYQRILAKDIKAVFEQALEMEKQQIIDSYNQGYRDGEDDSLGKDISLYNDAELYFNETYKK